MTCPAMARRNPTTAHIGGSVLDRFGGLVLGGAGRSGESGDGYGEPGEYRTIGAVPGPHVGSDGSDDIGVTKNAEMVRDRRLSERQLGGDVANGARAAYVKEFEDLKTNRMSKRLGNRYGVRVSESARFDRIFIEAHLPWRLSIHDSLRLPSQLVRTFVPTNFGYPSA